MPSASSLLIDVSDLRIGQFIQLEMGWMEHPFSLSSFKLSSEDQIRAIQDLGIGSVRYFPGRSDPAPPLKALDGKVEADQCKSGQATDAPIACGSIRAAMPGSDRERKLVEFDRKFADAARQYRSIIDLANENPVQARAASESLVNGMVDQMIANGESAIRLLSEGVGERSGQHPVNVMVLSLLLGRSLGLDHGALSRLGLASLLHDIGKQALPDRLRFSDKAFSLAEQLAYQSHVALGVEAARRMGLPDDAVQAIALHHEMADGSGFPDQRPSNEMSASAKILSLVNKYDNLCNPPTWVEALTPHEALSAIFAQLNARFDPAVLAAFIRMMGVYPPGSVVQLLDERYALVVSANVERPLRPKVVVFDPAASSVKSPVIDLMLHSGLGILRSLKPPQLPRAALEFLAPCTRICYFFETAVDPSNAGNAA